MKMSKHVNPDNIEKGVPVTILEGKKQEMTGLMGSSQEFEDTTMHGDILVVKAIILPYVEVRYVKKRKDLTLDMRDYKLIIPSQDYVETKLRKLKNDRTQGGMEVQDSLQGHKNLLADIFSPDDFGL